MAHPQYEDYSVPVRGSSEFQMGARAICVRRRRDPSDPPLLRGLGEAPERQRHIEVLLEIRRLDVEMRGDEVSLARAAQNDAVGGVPHHGVQPLTICVKGRISPQ